MKTRDLAAFDSRLEEFLDDLTASLGRRDRQNWAGAYVQGLLLDGERKSIEPLAGRIGLEDDVQNLRQFVSQSPWSADLVQAAMAGKAARLWPVPQAWIIDETSFPKAGKHSVGVARQYCGALGKIANCQVAVTLHYAGQSAGGVPGSAALGWRLLLPQSWAEDPERRAKAHVPEDVRHLTMNEHALDLVIEAQERGLPAAPVLADSAYGDDYGFRAGLREPGCAYCVAVDPCAKAWQEAPPELAPGARRKPGQEELPVPLTLEQIAMGLPRGAYHSLTLRPGTKAVLEGRFACVPVWAAHGHTQRRHRGQRACEWLLMEWPKGEPTPFKYWLASLASEQDPAPEAPGLKDLVLLAKGRFQVEQDYRELKEEVGLDHFEGRHWLGWHHHVTLASMAHLFLGSERLRLAEATARHAKKEPGWRAGASRAEAVQAWHSELAGDPAQVAGSAYPPKRALSLVPGPLPA